MVAVGANVMAPAVIAVFSGFFFKYLSDRSSIIEPYHVENPLAYGLSLASILNLYTQRTVIAFDSKYLKCVLQYMLGLLISEAIAG
jgi:hypothetical protein